MRSQVDKNDIPDDIKDPHFYNPIRYVQRTASWLQRFGVMPKAGGLDNQDKWWVLDMEMHFGMLNQAQRKQDAHDKENGLK